MKLGVFGASGRLGRAIVALAVQDPDVQVVGAWTHPKSASLGQSVQGVVLTSDASHTDAEVFIDVSLPAGIEQRLGLALAKRRPLVVGTTGLSESAHARLAEAGRHIPVFWTANFSLGMAVLQKLSREAARLFHPDADLDLVETHHTQKKDAPSGSARLLADAVQDAQPQGRAPRIHSVRSGAVVGEHELRLNVAEEQLTLRHQAHSRDVFARGALAAAKFLRDQKPGLYGMEHLLA